MNMGRIMRRMIEKYSNIFNNIKLKISSMKNSKKVRMKKIYCNKCNKYRKFKNHNILNILENSFVLSIICNKMKKYLKKNSWFN